MEQPPVLLQDDVTSHAETRTTVEDDVENNADSSVVPSTKKIEGDRAEPLGNAVPVRRMQRKWMILGGLFLVVSGLAACTPFIMTPREKTTSMRASSVGGGPLDDSGLDNEQQQQQQQQLDQTTTDYKKTENDVVDVEMIACFNSDTGYTPVDGIRFTALGGNLGNPRQESSRTFDVTPMHVVQDDTSVLFAVETVPDALPEHAKQPVLDYEQIISARQRESAEFYVGSSLSSEPAPQDILVEAMSIPDEKLIYAGGHGFLAACMMAFAQHLPLSLSPDDLWIVITNGFARHVQMHAEELRDTFVDFEGQETIRIREDSLIKSDFTGFGSSPLLWEQRVFPKFAEAVASHTDRVDPRIVETLVGDFTSSTSATRAASVIALMSAMSKYFNFELETSCGIPQVRLEGTREDWIDLRERTQRLAEWMIVPSPDNDEQPQWIPDVVIPILDEFVKSYDGHVNHCFWQNMVKFRKTGDDSGSYRFLSGWLPTLFPYLMMGGDELKPNPDLRHWIETTRGDLRGPKPTEPEPS